MYICPDSNIVAVNVLRSFELLSLEGFQGVLAKSKASVKNTILTIGKSSSRVIITHYWLNDNNFSMNTCQDSFIQEVFDEWMALMIQSLTLEEVNIAKQWICEHWIMRESIDAVGDCVSNTLSEWRKSESAFELKSELDYISKMNRHYHATVVQERVDLDWRNFVATIQIANWDKVFAEKMGWSVDELVFYLVESVNQLQGQELIIRFLRGMSLEYGNERLLKVIGSKCSQLAVSQVELLLK